MPKGAFISALSSGLQRARDKLMGDLRELLQAKPRTKADETFVSEITRLEPALQVARDDLVS